MKKNTEVQCGCGCGKAVTPGRSYVQGHDARFHSRVKRLRSGELKPAELNKELGKRGAYAKSAYRAAVKAH